MNQRTSHIVNPVYILSLILLLANDFYFKYAYASVVTGKLSDFAGLLVFYGFIVFLFGRNKTIAWCTALSFVYWKSGFSQPLLDFVNGVAPLKISRVVDYSDLVALMVLPIYHWYIQSLEGGNRAKALVPVLLPVVVFSISATSVIDPIIAERYDKYVSRYDYSDSEIIYKVNMPLNSLISRYKNSNYHVSDSYYIQPWDGTVYNFSPVDRCTKHAVFQEKGIENLNFDATQVQLKEVGQKTELRLYGLTLCHELSPLEKSEAIIVFEETFLAGIEVDPAK